MKDYQSIYERMDARRRAKMEEVAQMEENLEAKAQEIEDIDEEDLSIPADFNVRISRNYGTENRVPSRIY